jgi:hypothetical protein
MALGWALSFLALAISGSVASAQILYGSLTGTISDKTGAVIPKVTVTITDQGTGQVRTTQASELGTYQILNVLPGTYTLSVAKAGNFSGYAQKDIQVEVNRQVRRDVTLEPASVSTQVTVTEAAAELQTETAEVNSELNQSQLSEMPLTSSAGRSFEALYTLIPGGANVKEQNSTASNPSRAMSVNVNGMNMNGNTTRIDGAVNYYGWLTYLIAYVPPPDSIENVSITTNDFTAEQGQAGGASIKITTKSGTHDFHGSAWEYYQDANLNARPYTTTAAVSPTLPKNIDDQYGFNIGGPVYIPRILTGKKKLFFFDNWERTTQRKMTSGLQTVPDSNMVNGNFSEATALTTLYDPLPQVAGWQSLVNPTTCPNPNAASSYTNGYLNYACRPSFTAEYGETGNNVNTIPTSRQSAAAQTMIANLSKIAATVGTPNTTLLNNFMQNDYFGAATYAYNRTTNDAKITYIPGENTQIFGKYSVEPFQVNDPQELGPAGGGVFDGGQPGAAHGKVQNVGLGMSHVISPKLVVDADFGYTRQITGAQSTLDLSLGSYGLNVLKIPGTNISSGGSDYAGQPLFSFNSSSSNPSFSSIGNSSTANPFSFRDNQFTGDVNLSWIKDKHQVKVGFTYYHFDLNHFQPTSGGGVSNVRGGFLFSGGMTCGVTATATSASCGTNAYNDLADYLLGLPNGSATTAAVQKAQQTFDPNSLRWTELGAYAQDQWSVNQKLTLTYGVRWEIYPAAYRDHTGIYVVRVDRPQTSNVEIGGIMGNPKNAGVDTGHGFFAPRLGIAYRVNNKTVVRTGFGITVDPDSMRYLRDSFPMDLAPNYYSPNGAGTIAVDPATGSGMPLTYGIPIPTVPNYSSGFASLPVSGSTNSVWQNFRRGYIESWNIFVQRDLGHNFVANVGHVGNLSIRNQAPVSPYNSAPLPNLSTPCMPNGQVNPNTGLNPTGTGLPCSSVGGFAINEIVNVANCPPSSNGSNLACYNTGGITMNGPMFSSNYDALQAQLTRLAGKNSSLGVVYTYGHAFDYVDNGAGTGTSGTTFNYPAYYKMNRASAGFDVKQNLQIWGLYSLPFGYNQRFINHGLLAEIIGGWQMNGQFSHFGGTPFSVTANSNTLNTPGAGSLYAQLVAPYKQVGGHSRTFGNTAVSGGKPWFDPSSFANPVEPTASVAGNPTNASPVWPNTHRNQFRGPGMSLVNASLFKGFRVYHGSEFQVRFEAFNILNHAFLTNPNTTVPTTANVNAGAYSTFGMITSYGQSYSPTQGARSLQFGGRFNF